MKAAYLIDKEAIGGGNEYVRRKIAGRPTDECRVCYADRGECSAAKLNAWGAEEIVVNHLRALVQLFRNPFVQPKGRVVFVAHGLHLRKFDFLPRTLMNRLKRFVRRVIESHLYHKCDALIALTPTDRADILKIYGADLEVLIEPNTNDGLDLTVPGDLRYRPNAFAFVCIARNDFPKGQDILLAAVLKAQKTLRAQGKRLLLIGGAAVPSEIADLVESPGPIPNAGVYMTCGKVLISPSRWEGLPYLMLEAVARNRRVIASDCPGNRDVLTGYAQATLFSVCDVEGLAKLMEELS